MRWGLVVCFGMVGTAAAEGACFRTVAEAVRGDGVVEMAGFAVDGVVRDALRGGLWVRVRSCGHPEWPMVVVRGGRDGWVAAAQLGDREAVAKAGQGEVVVRAGAVVRVVSAGETVRMEVAGRAVENGAVGARVRVRVGEEGEERFVMGVVRSAAVLEMVR